MPSRQVSQGVKNRVKSLIERGHTIQSTAIFMGESPRFVENVLRRYHPVGAIRLRHNYLKGLK